MVTGWLVGALVLAVADWFAVALNQKRVRYFTKPAALLALIAWFWQMGGWQGALLWFGLALVFSWLGDVFLLLPQKYFVGGLASFLIAHVLYLIGFNLSRPAFGWQAVVFLLLVALAAWLVFPRIFKSLHGSQEKEKLRLPTAIYAIVISLMLLSALLNLLRPGWPQTAALITLGGAVLFFLSDSILATNRFARPIFKSELWVMITYHLAQFGIVLGALMTFAR